MENDLEIGIDCGSHTGVAAWSRKNKRFTFIKTMKIHEAMKLVYELGPQIHCVRVEDARLRGSRQTYRVGVVLTRAMLMEIQHLQGAGSVKRDSAIWEDYLEYTGIPYKMVKPNNTKMDAKTFKKRTGWDKPTNEHGRDAGNICWGF